MGNYFKVIETMFWKKVTRVRKGEQTRDEMVNDVNGQVSRDGVDLRMKCAEYFEQVMNAENVVEANINVVALVLMGLDEPAILVEDVQEAVNETKSGMALGLD